MGKFRVPPYNKDNEFTGWNGEKVMSYHILIVDDDPLMRNLLRDILLEERTGDQVETADSGWEALRMMNQGSTDILIADWQMPDMSGLRLVELAQALYPATHVVLVTPVDQGEVQERRRGRKISFTSFTKPFSIDAFLEHIASLLTEKSAPVAKPESTPVPPALTCGASVPAGSVGRRTRDEERVRARFSSVLGLA